MERCAPWRDVAPSRTAATRIPHGIRIASLASVIVLTAAGCDALSDPQDSVPWSLMPRTVTIAVGQKQQIGTVTRGNVTTWTSDDPQVASVSATGMASALAPGRTNVIRSLHGRADTTLVIVRAAVREVHMVTSSTPLALGGAMGLAFNVIDPAGDAITDLRENTIRWVSRNSDIASVDSAGLIRAKGLGSTEIILWIDGMTDSTDVHVTAEAPPGVPVEPPPSSQPPKNPTPADPPPAAPATSSVVVTIDSAHLAPGKSSAAHALAKDSKGNVLSGKTAAWMSLNSAVATVSTTGVVTAKSPGTVAIQGTIDGVSGTASLIVDAPPATTPPVTTPPPTSPTSGSGDLLSEPTFDATSATMLFNESFDNYTFNTLHPPCGSAEPAHTVIDHAWYYCNQFTTNGGPGYDAGVQVVPGHSGNGVQWHYDAVYQESHGVVTTGGSAPPTGQKATVVQYWARYKGDTATLGYSTVIQIKNVMLWHDQNRFQIALSAHSGNCPVYGPQYTMLGVTDQAQIGCESDQPIGPFLQSFADGQWHRWTIYYKPNSAKGARDAVVRLWIDGTLVIRLDKTSCGTTPPGGWKPWCDPAELDGIYSGTFGVGTIEWGAPLTAGNQPFTMAIDDFKWWVMK